jgi:hypothetical protein
MEPETLEQREGDMTHNRRRLLWRMGIQENNRNVQKINMDTKNELKREKRDMSYL